MKVTGLYFSVDIVFQQCPEEKSFNVYHKGKQIVLDIFEQYEKKIALNSYSNLVFFLSDDKDIYLLIREQGCDSSRTVTFKHIPEILKEIQRINNLPDNYSTRGVYKDFFSLRFSDIEDEKSINRTPGLQDRDAFYGYFRVKEGISYDGVNIKISHPIYCNGEGTDPSMRIRKAEYLGKPYVKNDLLYFQIEDNAVYLVKQEYNQQFGTFSGSESFTGKLEIMNKEGKILHEATGQFKGWER